MPVGSQDKERAAPGGCPLYFGIMRSIAVLIAVYALSLMLTAASGQERRVPESADEIRLSYAPIVKLVAPAVVNIYTRRVVRSRPFSPFFEDPFFERFFGDGMFGMPRERVENSLGSGVIIEAGGLIVTNHHVIENSDEVTVALADRREFPATLVGIDDDTDLAVLRIDTGGDPLPHLELGDSDRLEVGDLVLAVGNPFGVGQTVTSGIVSALARTSVGVTDLGSFIQTDAAVNPGNSGGALVTLDGKVVGINTAIFSRSGGSIGIGFAIPANLVRVVVDSVVAGGRAVRPWLGIDAQPVTQDIADSLALRRPVGILVNQLHPLSPAQGTGLRVGDVVSAVDGHEIYDAQGLRFRTATRPVGGAMIMTVLRNGVEVAVQVPLIAPPEDPPRDIRDLQGRHPLSGARVGNLSPAFAEELGIDSNRTGVIVLQVQRGAAARLGLRPGDIVVRIDDQAIDTTAILTDVLRRDRREWRITVNRNGENLSVVVRG